MADSQLLKITLRLPVGISEEEAGNIAYAALTKAKSYFTRDADGFEVEWFDLVHNDGSPEGG